MYHNVSAPHLYSAYR